MSEQPLVSVVIPTYNRARTVGAALQSVLDQTYGNVEVIVVDDGSTDDTARVVGSVRDERLIYVRQCSRTGAADARNRGISLAKGGLIAFQDSDDLWHRDKLERQVTTIGSLPVSCGMVYSHMLMRKPEGDVLFRPSSQGGSEGVLFDRLLRGAALNIGIQTCLVRRECFDKVGAFDTKLRRLIDREFFFRLARHFGMYELPAPLVTYVGGEGGISSNTLAAIEAQKHIMEKYGNHLRRDRRARAYQYLFLGNLFVEHGDYRSAGAAFRTAARLRPEPSYALRALLAHGDGRSFEHARRVKRAASRTGRWIAKCVG